MVDTIFFCCSTYVTREIVLLCNIALVKVVCQSFQIVLYLAAGTFILWWPVVIHLLDSTL